MTMCTSSGGTLKHLMEEYHSEGKWLDMDHVSTHVSFIINPHGKKCITRILIVKSSSMRFSVAMRWQLRPSDTAACADSCMQL
jgi:hypothetical protein